jgi:hypothetical protein
MRDSRAAAKGMRVGAAGMAERQAGAAGMAERRVGAAGGWATTKVAAEEAAAVTAGGGCERAEAIAAASDDMDAR